MKKEQKQVIAIAVLFTIAGLLFIKTFFFKKPLGEKAGPEIPGEVTTAGKQEEKKDFFVLEEALKKTRQKLVWERDPFEFPPKELERSEGLNLTGVIYDGESPVAVINDVIVHEGDEIEGVKVIKIEQNSVVLEKDGKPFTLELLKWEE